MSITSSIQSLLRKSAERSQFVKEFNELLHNAYSNRDIPILCNVSITDGCSDFQHPNSAFSKSGLKKVVTETKYRDDISIDYHSYTENDFWKQYSAPRWLSFMIDMLSEQRQSTRSKYISDNGVRKLRTYEYKFDGYGNWIECKVFVDGKPECLAIRKYKYI